METTTFPNTGTMNSVEYMYALGAYELYEHNGGQLNWNDWVEKVWKAA